MWILPLSASRHASKTTLLSWLTSARVLALLDERWKRMLARVAIPAARQEDVPVYRVEIDII